MRLVLLVVFLSIPSIGECCFSPPEYLRDDLPVLLETADAVVLATVVSRGESRKEWNSHIVTEFTFAVQSTLYGESESAFTFAGIDLAAMREATVAQGRNFQIDGYLERGDFSSHSDSAFWDEDVSNSWMLPDCATYGLFELGNTYLIFLRQQPHDRAYEQILSADDKWLEMVLKQIADMESADEA